MLETSVVWCWLHCRFIPPDVCLSVSGGRHSLILPAEQQTPGGGGDVCVQNELNTYWPQMDLEHKLKSPRGGFFLSFTFLQLSG